MFDFVENMLGKEDTPTKEVAKERLQLVLIHDRIGVDREVLKEMEDELLAVISKYLEIDEAGLEMDLQHQDDSMALVANIPLKKDRQLEDQD